VDYNEMLQEMIKKVYEDKGKAAAGATEFAMDVILSYVEDLENDHGMSTEEMVLEMAETFNDNSACVL
jgi:hypothetical protein